MPTKRRIIVIGGGVTGLAMAIRMRRYGHDVTVYEKNDFFGGRQMAVRAEGFTWDIGQDVLTDLRELEALYRLHSLNPRKYLSVKELEYDASYVLPSGQQVRNYHRPHVLAHELQQSIGEPLHSINQFMQQARYFQHYAAGLGAGSTKERLSSYARIHGLAIPQLYGSAHHLHQQYFQNESAVTFFDAKLMTRYGANPFSAPGLTSLYAQNETSCFWLKGGAHTIGTALLELAAKVGVTLVSATPVRRITHSEGRVTGVVTDTGWIACDAIIATTDIRHVYSELIQPNKDIVKNYLSKERDSARLTVCLGIHALHRNLDYKNIFVSSRLNEEMKQLWGDTAVPTEPTISLSITSKLDRSMAPKGCENWLITVMVPSRTAGSQRWVSTLRNRILERLSECVGENIEDKIVYEKVLRPSFFEDTFNMYEGSWRGGSYNSVRSSLLRHPFTQTQFKELYFLGQSAHSGVDLGALLHATRDLAQILR